jgi:hypothetical protein
MRNDIGIEPNHRRFVARLRNEPAVAPATIASPICSMVTGGRRDFNMPRSAVTGSFGNRTTEPSGWMKNFTLSPGFNPRWSRTAFGIVA